MIPQVSPVYHKSEKCKLFRKRNWFSAVHPNVQINAKLDYMINTALLEMDHTSLQKQTAFNLLTHKYPLVGYIITGQQNNFATLNICNVISLFQCKTLSAPFYVRKNLNFEGIIIVYQNNR